MLKPTAYLHFSLAGEGYESGDAALIKRSFSYVAPTEVTPGDVSAIDLLVRLSGKHYLDASDPQSQATWEDVVCPWLAAKLKKVEDTLDACNDEDARSFTRHFSFSTLNLFLEDRVFSLRIEDDTFPVVIDIVEHVRDLIAQGDERCTSATQFFCPSPEEEREEDALEAQCSSTEVQDEDVEVAESADDCVEHILRHERGSYKVRHTYRSIGALAPSGDTWVIPFL